MRGRTKRREKAWKNLSRDPRHRRHKVLSKMGMTLVAYWTYTYRADVLVQIINVHVHVHVYTWQRSFKSTRNTVPVVVQELPGYLMAGWTRCMNVLVSCDYQDGSAAGGKSLAMCFGAIVALSKVLKSVSGVTSLSFHQDRWLP